MVVLVIVVLLHCGCQCASFAMGSVENDTEEMALILTFVWLIKIHCYWILIFACNIGLKLWKFNTIYN